MGTAGVEIGESRSRHMKEDPLGSVDRGTRATLSEKRASYLDHRKERLGGPAFGNAGGVELASRER